MSALLFFVFTLKWSASIQDTATSLYRITLFPFTSIMFTESLIHSASLLLLLQQLEIYNVEVKLLFIFYKGQHLELTIRLQALPWYCICQALVVNSLVKS